MRITFASESAPGRANEDYAVCGPNWAAILDGATAPAGVDSGCIHDVRWVVRQLAAALSKRLVLERARLPDLLAAAIEETCQAHAHNCDLENPDSPSSTVSIVRIGNHSLEYLTLGDSPIILRHRDHTFTPIVDNRTDHLPGGRPYTVELVSSLRNKPGGFWVASTNPKAAYHAVSGNVHVDGTMDVALLTDGVTRLIEWYGLDWPAIFTVLTDEGPSSLIACVRSAERKDPPPHGKQHDDATAVHIRNI